MAQSPLSEDLLESAGRFTFRKTFTPNVLCKNVTEHDKNLMSKFCELFGKEKTHLSEIFTGEDPAKAAAAVLGYSYEYHGEEGLYSNPHMSPETLTETESEPVKDNPHEDSPELRIAETQDNYYENVHSEQDLWKAVPAIADPDNLDSSFETNNETVHYGYEVNRELTFATETCVQMEIPLKSPSLGGSSQQSGVWDPDAAFSEVERIMENLEDPGRAGLGSISSTSSNDYPSYCCERDDDKQSDDSGMSSANTSNSGREETSKPIYARVCKPQNKPTRKVKQLIAQLPITNSILQSLNEQNDSPDTRSASRNLQLTSLSGDISFCTSPIYEIALDSPTDSESKETGFEPRRIRFNLQEDIIPNPGETLPNSTWTNRCEAVAVNASQILENFKENFASTMDSTQEAWNRVTLNLNSAVKPITVAINEAGEVIKRATEPLVQQIQVLGTRLQVRYMYAARNNQWLAKFSAMREADSCADFDHCIPKSQNGFEELRKHVKEGGDLGKELSTILQERSELEASYAKGLAKLAAKLAKTVADLQGNQGTITTSWAAVANEMESQAEIHKALSVSLSEDLVKPLKAAVETQHKVRKAVEAAVEKTGRTLAEWRSAQAKAKKQCYLCSRENEKIQDQVYNDSKLGKPRILTDKETAKLDAKRKKTEEAVRKAEGDYYTCCVRAERARLEWETTTQRGGQCFCTLEHERLTQLKDLITKYRHCVQEMGPKYAETMERLGVPVAKCSVEEDMQSVLAMKDSSPNFGEQLLPDFYAEHMSNVMNKDRRKESLERCLHWIRADIEREARGKRGVENLARALQDTPNFGGDDSQQDVSEKLHHMRATLAFLEVTRVKLHNSLAELDGSRDTKISHPLYKHLEVHKDKQGMMQSVLKLPPWIDNEDLHDDWHDGRGTADGNSGQPDSDFDEFSSQDSDGECSTHSVVPCSNKNNGTAVPSIGKCRALYTYAANMYDELTIQPGDIINIHDKQADGWWLGELDGTVGIFPATYVEEV